MPYSSPVTADAKSLKLKKSKKAAEDEYDEEVEDDEEEDEDEDYDEEEEEDDDDEEEDSGVNKRTSVKAAINGQADLTARYANLTIGSDVNAAGNRSSLSLASSTASSSSSVPTGPTDPQTLVASEIKRAASMIGSNASMHIGGMLDSYGSERSAVVIDQNNPSFAHVKMPVYVDFCGTPEELSRRLGKDLFVLDPAYVKAAGIIACAEKFKTSKRVYEGMSENLARAANTAKVAIKSVKPRLASNQMPFPVAVNIPRTTCLVGSRSFTPGLIIPADTAVPIKVDYIPMGMDRPWEEIKGEISTFAALTPDKVSNIFIQRPSPTDPEYDKCYHLYVHTPLGQYVRNNEERFLQKKIMDKQGVIVDDKYIKITKVTRDKIVNEVLGRHGNLPLQQNFTAQLVRADGKSWESCLEECASFASTPLRAWLMLELELLVYVDAGDF
jgi:hypothetical protein